MILRSFWPPRRPEYVCGLALFLLLTGCKVESREAPPPPPAEVTVVETEPKDTPVAMEFVGKTASSRRVEIRSRIEGFLEERLFDEGTLVEEGQVLYQMDQKPFQAELRAAEAELAQQLARQETAEAHLARIRPLAEQNAVAQKELDDALGNFRSTSASVEAARAKVVQAELDLSYTTIHTPVTGLSSYSLQQEGAYIGYATGSALTYVAQVDPIWIEFSVSENQLLKSREQVKQGAIRTPEEEGFEVEIVLADGTVFPETGRITFSDASLSEETGTFLIRAELANPDGHLRPGQFVRVFLKGAYRPDAILIPQRAVQQGSKGSFVWVADSGKAQLRPVVVGSWHRDQWFIEEGLEGGESVVVDGAIRLRAGVPVTIVDPESTSTAGAKNQGPGT